MLVRSPCLSNSDDTRPILQQRGVLFCAPRQWRYNFTDALYWDYVGGGAGLKYDRSTKYGRFLHEWNVILHHPRLSQSGQD